jgi:hypothetical protein
MRKKGKLMASEFRKFIEYVGKPDSFFDRNKTLKILAVIENADLSLLYSIWRKVPGR